MLSLLMINKFHVYVSDLSADLNDPISEYTDQIGDSSSK